SADFSFPINLRFIIKKELALYKTKVDPLIAINPEEY
ncbi:hypothetical protein S1OALGB6SA_1035, partial [Olavius algarvensis spirochete endosymbiont]